MREEIGGDFDAGTGVQLRHQGFDIAAGAKSLLRFRVQYDADDVAALAPFQQFPFHGLEHLQGQGIECPRVVELDQSDGAGWGFLLGEQNGGALRG